MASRLRVGIVCADNAYSAGLSKALGQTFAIDRDDGPIISPRQDADVLIYAFTDPELTQPDFPAAQAHSIRSDVALTKIFLELVSAESLGPLAQLVAAKNKVIAQLAHDHGGYLVPLMSKFMRWDPARLLTEAGTPNRRGYQAIARTVAKFIDRFDVRRSLAPEGGTAHLARGPSSQSVLSSLQWGARDLPRTIRFAPDAENIADLIDSQISFPSYPNWGRVQLSNPVDWSMPGPNRSWQSYFLGLEFLGPSLGLCYALISGSRLRDNEILLGLLKRRRVAPAQLLDLVGRIIADFLRANPPGAPMAQRAWHEGTVCRRLKILLAYLICCRSAQARGEVVDEDTVALAFLSVLSSIEMLRSEKIYIKSGNHGVRQDTLLIVTALLFERMEALRGLLSQSLDRLRRCQLDTMLTADGVWQENSFEYHRLIMGLLSDLAFDMHTAGAKGADRLLDAVRRMLVFAEAVVKCDGQAPLIGDTAPRDTLRAIVNTRALIASLSGDRAADPDAAADKPFERSQETYFFPASGYFASHSARVLGAEVSSVIFYGNLSAPKHKQADDLSVLFSHGMTDLLVDGGTYNKETSDHIRNAARFDPATHNTYRVNGKGYSVRAQPEKSLAGIPAMWSGEGWAAAHGYNKAYEGGRVDRFVIHIKHHQALVVIDRLTSASFLGAEFEQFWHIAPQFHPPANLADTINFSSADSGSLLVAFDDGASTYAIEQGGPGNPIAWLMTKDDKTVPTPYIRRSRKLRKGYMASLFQWARASEHAAVAISARGQADIAGFGFSASFAVDRDAIKCLQLRN